MVNAIVLAGDGGSCPLQGVETKSLIRINGRYMIEYVIDSLNSCTSVDRVVVVGPGLLKDILQDKVEGILSPGCSIMENFKLGVNFLNDSRHIIVCTSDIPMVSGEAIDDFVYRCVNMGVDIGYPIIDKMLNDAKYPDVRRTYVKMKDGIYTGGNIIYVNPAALDKCLGEAERLVENRKNAMKMGRVFGILILIKLAAGVLKISDVEKRVSRLFGINARAVKTPYPEIGNDVDKDSDVEFVNRYMGINA